MQSLCPLEGVLRVGVGILVIFAYASNLVAVSGFRRTAVSQQETDWLLLPRTAKLGTDRAMVYDASSFSQEHSLIT
jgi:hypothetical protein